MSQKHFAKVLAQHPSQIITVWTGGDPTPRGGGKSLPSTFLEAAACHSFSVNSGVRDGRQDIGHKEGLHGYCTGSCLGLLSPAPHQLSLQRGRDYRQT